MKRLILAAAALAFSGSSLAADSGSALELFAGTMKAELPDNVGGTFEPSGEEFGARLRFGMPTGAFAAASYERMSGDDNGVDLDVDEMHLGVGFQGATAPNANLSIEVQYITLESEIQSGSGVFAQRSEGDFDGFGAYAGLSGQIAPNAQIYARLGYVALEDDGSSTELDGYDATAGLAFTLANNLGLFGEYRIARLEDDNDNSVDLNNARVGVRFSF